MPIVVVKVILLIHVGDELSAMVRVLDFSSLDCASLSEFRAAWYHSAIFYQQNFLKRQMCYKVAQDSQFWARSFKIWRERDEIHCICSLF